MQTGINEKKYDVIDLITMSLLFLFAADVVNKYFYFLYGAFLGIVIIKNGIIRLNGTVFWLGILSLSILLFNPSYSYGVLGILKTFTYLVAYLLGYNAVKKAKKEPQKTVIVLVVIITAGMLLHLILNLTLNINIDTREPIDYWLKKVTSATLQAAIGIWAIAVGVGVLISDAKIIYKLLGVTGIAVVMYYNLILAGRTLIVILLIIALVALINLVISLKIGYKRLKVFVGVLLIVGVVCCMFHYNTFGLQDIFENSNFYTRIYGDNGVKLSEDKRGEIGMLYISNMSKSIFGGGNIREFTGGKSAHDLYLNTYDDSGIFALMALLAVTIISLSNLLKILKKTDMPFVYRQIILCIYVACHLEFFVEPIMGGMPWFYASFCILDGAVRALLDSDKKDSKVPDLIDEASVST